MRRKTVSEITLILLLIGMLILTFNIQPVKASGTIYVGSDYTFTSNIFESIVVTADNIIIDGNGYILQGTGSGTGIDLSYRSNVTIKNVNINGFVWGIYLWHSSNNTISGNQITCNIQGVRIESSSNNIVSGNDIVTNSIGVRFWDASNNTISGNIIANVYFGIILSPSCDNNTIFGNDVKSDRSGITLLMSSNNTVYGNKITNSDRGIMIEESPSNIVSGNNITGNEIGIWLIVASNNTFYHNLISNTQQVYDYSWDHPPHSPSINAWDNGYPSGGNYWSDYAGVDVKSGPNQDQPNSDGIGDTEYVIDENNRDRYPLMYTGPFHQLTVTSLLVTGIPFTINGALRTTPYTEWLLEGSYTLEMPITHNGYVWSHWLEDGSPNRIKTILLQGTTWTAVYEPAPKPVGGKTAPINIPMNKPETPALWIWLTIIILSLASTVVCIEKRKRNAKIIS